MTIGGSENGDVDVPRGTIFLYICVLVVLGVRYSSSLRISMSCTHALIPDCHVCSCTNGPYFWSAKGDQASPPLSSLPGRCRIREHLDRWTCPAICPRFWHSLSRSLSMDPRGVCFYVRTMWYVHIFLINFYEVCTIGLMLTMVGGPLPVPNSPFPTTNWVW